MNLEIKYIPLDTLLPYVRNSRTHSEEQVAQIAGSIKEFGFTNPLLIGSDFVIIAGHGRLQAARKLKMLSVPCITLEGLSDTKRKALIIADNKLALNSGWDFEMLGLELSELEESGFDLALTGFSGEELEDLVGANAEEVEMPALRDGEKEPFQQITFTLHDEQVEQLEEALKLSKGMGEFIGSINENSNGNALSRICELFITQNHDS